MVLSLSQKKINGSRWQKKKKKRGEKKKRKEDRIEEDGSKMDLQEILQQCQPLTLLGSQ